MTWTVEMNSGCFQGDSLKELVDDIADFYCRDDEYSVEQITDLYWMNDEGMCCQVSEQGISWFQDQCDETQQRYQQEIAEEREHQRQLRSDYCASIL